MKLKQWIRSRAAKGQALNLHAVLRERPDLLEKAFSGPTPRGWFRSLIDAGVDPYKIVHAHEDQVECVICGCTFSVLGSHLKRAHGMSGEDYRHEFGPECELSSELFRANRFKGRRFMGMKHWEGMWSRYYIIDVILRLDELGHDLNFWNVVQYGGGIVPYALLAFGSWDAALKASGLDPDELRIHSPRREWKRAMVIQGLRDLAKIKKKNWRRQMSDSLRAAVKRHFRTLRAACKAAGIAYEEISSRAIFNGAPVFRLVADIHALEGLKGRERRRKLDAIYHKNADSKRIVTGHFGSLRKLAAKEGIDPKLVAMKTYRDEADVHHDLDLLERAGKLLCCATLIIGHKRLYNVISETGWGAERLQ
jgi:hypothetical protein